MLFIDVYCLTIIYLCQAARRRMTVRLYIPLPDYEARYSLVVRLLRNNKHDLSEDDINQIGMGLTFFFFIYLLFKFFGVKDIAAVMFIGYVLMLLVVPYERLPNKE